MLLLMVALSLYLDNIISYVQYKSTQIPNVKITKLPQRLLKEFDTNWTNTMIIKHTVIIITAPEFYLEEEPWARSEIKPALHF